MGYQFNPLTGNLDLVGDGGGNPFDQNLNTTNQVSFTGIGNGTTSPIRKYHQEGGKFLVNSDDGGYGQFQFINPIDGETSFVIATNSYPNEDGTISSNSDNTNIWGFGIGMYGNDSNIFTIGNANSYEILRLTDGFGATINGNINASGSINATNIGTAAAKEVPVTGNATSTQVVLGSDTRLTDSRTPTAHTHPLSALTQSSATTGQVATWNGTAWAAATPSTGPISTDGLTEGTTNLYFTSSRAVSAVTWSTLTGKPSFSAVATSGSASDLGSGTLPDARLSSNVALLTSTQTLTNKTLTNPNVGNGSTNAILTAYTANILSVSNSTTACGFSIFNTRTDASNYEAGIFDFTTNANSLTIGTTKAGTGTARRVRINSAEQIDFYCTDTSRMFQVSTSSVTAFNSFGFQWFSSASDPTTSSTPFSNGSSYCAIYKNTTSGVVSLWVRDGSTMKKVALA
jgi:hypothetical protein